MNKNQLEKIARGMCKSCGKEKIYKANLCRGHYEKAQQRTKRWYVTKGREQVKQRRAERNGEVPYDWTCAKCGAGNEDIDRVCWRCFEKHQ